MKKYQSLILFLGTMFYSGCAAVPKQVVDAMKIQQEELARVKSIYFVNMNNQLDAIEKYRLAILEIHEEQLIAQQSKSLDKVSKNGVTQIIESVPTGDIDVDHINLGKLKVIQEFFKAERAKVVMDIKSRREQINLGSQNFENIEEINRVMNNYMQSLTRLKNSQDKLAMSIKSHIEKLVPIPFSFEDLPDPKTIEDAVKNLTLK